MSQKILIYDDENKQTERFEKKLQMALNKVNQDTDIDIELLSEDELKISINALRDRQAKFRNVKTASDKKTKFDDVSVFIIDYDLINSNAAGFLTGEIIAYVVRCFSDCKLIVSLNQYGHNSFDLTLRGHMESFADLNLGVDQLGNSDLWRGDWGDSRRGFRPWYWPNLFQSLCHFDERVKDVKENLDVPICEVLCFTPELFRLLPRSIVQFIGKGEGKEPSDTTFREFVFQSGNGLRIKDVPTSCDTVNDEVLARVGAARISKWLERLVLPEQDILVDTPHLVARYPSLIIDTGKGIGNWNRTAQLVDYNGLGLNTDLITPFKFEKEHWISRPVWFWDKLREDESIEEVREPWLTNKPNWVFCEDASRFYDQKDCREFFANTDSPFTRRFVKGFAGVDYRPKVRFSL